MVQVSNGGFVHIRLVKYSVSTSGQHPERCYLYSVVLNDDVLARCFKNTRF